MPREEKKYFSDLAHLDVTNDHYVSMVTPHCMKHSHVYGLYVPRTMVTLIPHGILRIYLGFVNLPFWAIFTPAPILPVHH